MWTGKETEIGVGLENVRRSMLLKDAVDRLNGMWCYDNLTMLYNRSGFSYEAKTMMDRFKDADMDVYIIFMDADGLKTANDTLGHDVGDMMIPISLENICKYRCFYL